MAVVVRVIVCADWTTPRGVVWVIVVSDVAVSVVELPGRPRPRCCAPAGTVTSRAARAPIAIRVALMPCFLVGDERGQLWTRRVSGSIRREARQPSAPRVYRPPSGNGALELSVL